MPPDEDWINSVVAAGFPARTSSLVRCMAGGTISTTGSALQGPNDEPVKMPASELSETKTQFAHIFNDVSSYDFNEFEELVFTSPRGTMTLARR